jgi:hypothetical protein
VSCRNIRPTGQNANAELDDARTTPTTERKTWVSVLSHVYAWLVVLVRNFPSTEDPEMRSLAFLTALTAASFFVFTDNASAGLFGGRGGRCGGGCCNSGCGGCGGCGYSSCGNGGCGGCGSCGGCGYSSSGYGGCGSCGNSCCQASYCGDCGNSCCGNCCNSGRRMSWGRRGGNCCNTCCNSCCNTCGYTSCGGCGGDCCGVAQPQMAPMPQKGKAKEMPRDRGESED